MSLPTHIIQMDRYDNEVGREFYNPGYNLDEISLIEHIIKMFQSSDIIKKAKVYGMSFSDATIQQVLEEHLSKRKAHRDKMIENAAKARAARKLNNPEKFIK